MNPRIPLCALCVDDDDDTRDILALQLRAWGLEVEVAGTAAEALELSQTKQFDLYVLDAWLPDLDGFELCRKLRRRAGSTARIVFFSGAAYDTDIKSGYAAGANAYVSKPNVCHLFETLVNFIAEARVHETKARMPVSDFSRLISVQLPSYILLN